MHTRQKFRVPSVNQQVNPHRNDKNTRPDSDLGFPLHEENHQGKRQKNRDYCHKMPSSKHGQRTWQRLSVTFHQGCGHGKRPTHAGINAVVKTRKNDGPPKGRHGCYVSHTLDGRIAETVGRTVSTFEPDLVRTLSVKPPMGAGTVRLISVGEDAVDLQPCGGTHVARTGEIGPLTVAKIENKGRQNRRITIAFAE